MTQPHTADVGGGYDARKAAEGAFLAVLGRRIRRLRLLAELTQAELAAASGMSRSFVSLIENGDCSLQVVRLLRIADALHVPPAALLSDPPDCSDPVFYAAGAPLTRREWTSAADPETQTLRSAR